MFVNDRRRQTVLCALLVALAVVGAGVVTPAWAGKDKGVKNLVKNQNIYGDLQGEWWEWVFDPDNGFGMFAEGEVDCSLGQHGKVWFLAGTFGGPAERHCTIPKGKILYVPLVNGPIFYEEGVDIPEYDLTIEQKRLYLDGLFGGGPLTQAEGQEDPGVLALSEAVGDSSGVACDLHATLDGSPVVFSTPIVRAQSGPFTITTDDEAIADGFYVLLKPLSRGMHVLTFGGALCSTADGMRTFETSVTYHLHVARRHYGSDGDSDSDSDWHHHH